MAGNRKVISFFLASPSDLAVERKIAKKVADELNSMLSQKLSVHIELVGWEDTVSSAGRPQEIINRDLERCDVFIGLLWKRWGSAPDNESKYESGFEEEFTIATTGNKKSKKPLVSLFFKKIDATALSDPGEQLQKVIKFKKNIIDEKALLFQEFESSEDFESVIRKCISNYALEHVDLSDVQPQAAHAPDSEDEGVKAEQDNDSFDLGPIRGKSANFIQSILRGSGNAPKRAKLEPFEVARLRLISNGLGDGQNDKSYLGAHDANLIYKNKDKFALEDSELLGLLQSAAKSLQYENIPIWYWLEHSDNEYYNLNFLTLTVADSEYAIINAILDLMTVTRTDIKVDDFFTRQQYVENWLSDKKNNYVKSAALRYLSEMGVGEDLIEIQKEIDRNSSQTIGLASEAYVSIKLRSGLAAGLKAVNDLQPAILSTKILDRLFENPSHISSEVLNKTAGNRNKTVRAKAIEILIVRDCLPQYLLELIQQDPEASVRGLAISAFIKNGANLSEDEAKAIIMKNASKPTSEEDGVWLKYKPMIFSLMDDDELERRIHRYLPLNTDAYIEASRRRIDAHRSELTKNLKNKYEDFYKKHLRAWAESTNSDVNTIEEKFESLKQYIIKNLIRDTLNLFVGKNSKKDLSVVRLSLADPAVSPVEADLKYLQMHGEWQDILLVIDIVRRFGQAEGKSLLGSSEISLEACSLAVNTILKLGKDRIADVLALDCPSKVRRNIISSIKDKDFAAIEIDVILNILSDDDAEVRKHCAIKCAKTYSKKRLSVLFERYNSRDQTFYNVIYWLDFGMYGSKDQIKSVFSYTLLH